MLLNKIKTSEEKKTDVVEEGIEFPLTKRVMEEDSAQVEHEQVDHDEGINESLYGLKQSPRKWYKRFDSYMLKINFRRCLKDCCVYYHVFEDEKELEEKSKVPYASVVGYLMCAMVCTRPNLAQALSIVSGYMANPERSVDADYTWDLDKRRSTINWRATLQSVTTLSMTEVEYIALVEAGKEFDNEEFLLAAPLPECWVVSKLHLLIDTVTTSYDKFFFGDVGRETYDFFWSDFADWYIEASKARLYNSGNDSDTLLAQAVLLYIFENILKLLHPFMPFVTEELWQALPKRKEALIVSSWPQTSLPRHLNSIKRFENLQALTRAIRNARAEYSVEPVKRISASIVANEEVLQYISKEKEVLALLSRLDLQNVHFTESPPGDANASVHLVASEGLEAFLPLADMVDLSAEVQRLSKRLSKMQSEYDGLVARLNSPNFVEKAPEDIVRGVREKAAEAEEKINLTKNRLDFLKSTVLVT
ncbi:hypothetical protein EZV62_004876 [Acer yangbiense]|uniref:valine--tRNA ligase n=1 Tax=Acer yangbiense TaxID=1000413 RepID=A0A5C7IL60_9ROSI|nr:hypothetical protein EZV62_004876 [Acer yangbiense]